MIEGTSKTFKVLSSDKDIFKKAKLTADAGFHMKKNMEMVFSQGIDAYIADRHFRKQDPRFKDQDRFKQRAQRRENPAGSRPEILFLTRSNRAVSVLPRNISM
ncbi:hypothetical protein DBT_0454 [Dissulfuribacter thermophilus]|uniref:Uncharacterized protein n=1 Tax=Dissulfuribacter thermophilus TaxID=1156395 RepID=A0A1B9F7U7_9BACT|nr:hypothetical protein [Dissulfuribacter thermophilus]OCC15992.1 hypothetical protein DBT_0454 [Dissulfuribacter thermophilus]